MVANNVTHFIQLVKETNIHGQGTTVFFSNSLPVKYFPSITVSKRQRRVPDLRENNQLSKPQAHSDQKKHKTKQDMQVTRRRIDVPHGTQSLTLLQLLANVEFAATAILSFLTPLDLGDLSATARVLRDDRSAVYDAFYATTIVCMPTADAFDGGGAEDPRLLFVQRMQERKAHLVTRVRVPDASFLDQASCFSNAKEVVFVSDKKASTTKWLRRFPRLEVLELPESTVFDPCFLGHLPRLRKLDLLVGFCAVNASLTPPLAHLEHLAISVECATSL